MCAPRLSRSEWTSATKLLGAQLMQVISVSESTPDEVQRAIWNLRGGWWSRTLTSRYPREFVKSLPCLRRVFIYIDALDRFPAKHLRELWESLQQIVRKCLSTRLCLTKRVHMRDEAQKYVPGIAGILLISPREHDIGLYLQMKLDEDSARHNG